MASLLTDSKSDPDKDEENRYCTWQVNGLIEMQFFKVRPQSESHFMHKYNYSLKFCFEFSGNHIFLFSVVQIEILLKDPNILKYKML